MTRTSSFLITGATGELGEATIRQLAQRGDRLLLTGRNAARLAELEKAYGSSGVIETYQVDATRPEGARDAVAETVRRLGGVDGLVHMIGGFQVGPVIKTQPADYERLFRVCFLSAVYATQAVLPRLTDGGRLVYFGSPLVTEPMPGLGCYAASKAALLSWMRALAHEVKHDGVHANAVVFPMADSPRARRERPHVDFDQAVTPELVARVVGFLTSDAADGLYGSLVPVLGKFGFTTPLAGGPPPGVTKGRGATPKRPVAVPEAAR